MPESCLVKVTGISKIRNENGVSDLLTDKFTAEKDRIIPLYNNS